MSVLAAALPLLLLIGLMTVGKGVPAHRALPLAALILYALQLVFFDRDAVMVHASVVAGALSAATPLLILWGAIFFFKSLEVGGSLESIRGWLNGVSPHPVAQVMLIGWSFSFFIEGVSGFGTPAVMAAPLLVSMGFDPLRVVVLCLVMNTVPVTFGAVGTPIWFGLGELGLSAATLKEIGSKAALMQGAAALVIPVWALALAVPRSVLMRSLLFVYLSVASAIVPYLLLAKVNYEFPTIVGGLCSMITTAFLAKRGIGLSAMSGAQEARAALGVRECARAFLPFAAVVAILLLTRLQGLGLREWLMSGGEWIRAPLGGVGELTLSSSLVVEIQKIFSTDVAWKHPLLYVPSLLPFGIVALISLTAFRVPWRAGCGALTESASRLVKPGIALIGAMILVKLFMLGGEGAPAFVLGGAMASAFGSVWNLAAVYLGVMGAFFAGSCTISNLTFGPIQAAVAGRLHMDPSLVLALQTVGGAAGNMICIHNIVAVSAVLGLQHREGTILKKLLLMTAVYGLIAGVVSIALF